MRRPTALYPLFAATLLLALSSSESWALKRRPMISSAQQCTIDAVAAQADLSCEGAICSCCYCDGCYICGADGRDCVWEPAFSEASCNQQGQVYQRDDLEGFQQQLEQDQQSLPQISLADGGITILEQ